MTGRSNLSLIPGPRYHLTRANVPDRLLIPEGKMSKHTDEYFKGIPTRPYDLIKEGVIVLSVVTVIVLIFSAVLSSPDYPTITGKAVATKQPVAYVQTCADILAGQSGVQNYGPPYSNDNANAQEIAGIAPATWWGVKTPVDPTEDFILKPLERMSVIDPQITGDISTYRNAFSDQQQQWVSAYLSALDNATVKNGNVVVAPGNYGPVEPMMNAMLTLGRSGLLEGALESSSSLPFSLDYTFSLLFFQDNVDESVAEKLDMIDSEWGVAHETGNYPGSWWLWPYSFWYQIPPMNSSDNGDIQAIAIFVVLFLVLMFLPFIPGLRSIPRFLFIYRIIWRDWYHQKK